LIIRQGERILRHELSEQPVVIGRDPECDLYFSDMRLSRRHARIQVTPEGTHFEDLGSRNGSYVGSERVEKVDLKPGVSVRLGGLVIDFEEEVPPPPPIPAMDETVVLDRSSRDEDKTVMLPAQAPEKVTVGDETAILPRSSGKLSDAKTALLDAKALAGKIEKGPPDTMILDRSGPPPPAPPVVTPAPSPDPEHDAVAGNWASSLSWSAKYLVVVASVAFLVYFILAFPLVRTLGSALTEESLRRGRVLLSLAAASNGDAVGEGRLRDASVESVLREERVKEVLLLDLEGNVLAPGSRADEKLSAIEGIDADLGDIRTFYLGRRGSDYVIVEPLLHRGRRVGLAVVVYEAATASASWATAVLVLAFLTLLLGVVAALVAGKRMTLVPLASLQDDVEAVIKGDEESVPLQQGFAELTELAKSVNRLIARSTPVRAAAPRPAGPAGKRKEPAPSVATSRVAAAPGNPGAPGEDVPRFWIDESFIVTRADEGAAAHIGVTASAMEGKHLIEAVSDQKLLEVILDAVNALEKLPTATARADRPDRAGGGVLEVRASRDEQSGGAVVSFRESSGV